MLWAVAGVLLVACGGREGEQPSNPPPVATRPPANRALTISIPQSSNVLVGRQQTVAPMASDPDGDPLTFSVSNRPAWLSFSAQTGVLTGTPSTGTVGSYPNIQIKVSDGTLQASLAAFSIAVQQSANGTATPSQVRYGNAAGTYPTTITLSNPGITSYMVEILSSGTYFFVLASYDSTGLESANSNPASNTIL